MISMMLHCHAHAQALAVSCELMSLQAAEGDRIGITRTTEPGLDSQTRLHIQVLSRATAAPTSPRGVLAQRTSLDHAPQAST